MLISKHKDLNWKMFTNYEKTPNRLTLTNEVYTSSLVANYQRINCLPLSFYVLRLSFNEKRKT